jgi:hypothetical protein
MIKTGVDLRGLQPQMAIAYVIVKDIYKRKGYECVITSGNDSKHGPNSLHYQGKALDIRTRTILPQDLTGHTSSIHAEMKIALGEQFDVVLEKDHFHIEFDPKEPVIKPEDR